MFSDERVDTVWANRSDPVQRGKLRGKQREGTTVRPWPGVGGRGRMTYKGAVTLGKHRSRRVGIGQVGG